MKLNLSPKAVRLAEAIALHRKAQDAVYAVAAEHNLKPESCSIEDEMQAIFCDLVLAAPKKKGGK